MKFGALLLTLSLIFPCFADEIDDIVPYIIQVESGGDPNAIGEHGEAGLMQISPAVLYEYGLCNSRKDENTWEFIIPAGLFDESKNIMVGKWYLRRLRDHYLKQAEIYCVGNDTGWQYYNVYDSRTEKYHGSYGTNNLWKHNIDDFDYADEVRLALILAAYNGGITRLRKCGYNISCMPKSTRRYVQKVMYLYKKDEVQRK